MKKITKITTIAIVGIAALVVGISQMPNMDKVAPNDAHTLIGGEGTLAEQRAAVLKSGVIPDYYLISKTGEVWLEEHTQTDIDNHERILVNMLNHGEDTNMRKLTTGLSLVGSNFVTLSEKPDVELDEVAALALQRTILNGSYVVPTEEPIRKYYTHLLDNYTLPTTVGAVDQRLTEIAGEMAPLADTILETYTQWAELGAVRPALLDTDVHYWWAVTYLFECEYNEEDDCSLERDHLENERWNDDPGEFIPPPGEKWPPVFNFIIPKAYG